MLFSKATLIAAAAAFASLANGQQQGEGDVKVHVVQVSDTQGSLKFFPEELKANQGDMVQFHFYPRNHSLAQSSFADPCVPIADSPSGNGTQGFFSGFMPVTPESDTMPTFTILVNSTAPIWYYCATGPHCQRGMVGVINAPENNPDRTLAKYKEGAAGATTKVPGPPAGGDGGNTPRNGTQTGTGTGAPTPTEAGGSAAGLVASSFTFAIAVAAGLLLA